MLVLMKKLSTADIGVNEELSTADIGIDEVVI